MHFWFRLGIMGPAGVKTKRFSSKHFHIYLFKTIKTLPELVPQLLQPVAGQEAANQRHAS
jgi:hypothetical protein